MRRIAFILVLLLLIPNSFQYRSARKDASETSSSGSELRCAIALGKGMRSSMRFGFNYELLQEFASTHGYGINIRAAEDSLSLCDSLLAGVYDLAVLRSEDSTSVKGIRKLQSPDGNYIWAARDDAPYRLLEYDCWLSYAHHEDPELMLMARMFEKPMDPFKRMEAGIRSKHISPYDNLIRTYAKTIGWDWKLLAALIFTESKFTINNISPRGAIGLMQVKPLEKHGDAESLMDPQTNIAAGTELISIIQNKYVTAPEIDPFEKRKLVLASYNAGAGRIAECRRLAAGQGLDPNSWEDVKKAFAMHPEFKGESTARYVDYVLSVYEAFNCTTLP